MDFKVSNIDNLITMTFVGVPILIGFLGGILFFKKRQIKIMVTYLLIFVIIIPLGAYYLRQSKELTTSFLSVKDDGITIKYTNGTSKKVLYEQVAGIKIKKMKNSFGKRYYDYTITEEDKKETKFDTKNFKDPVLIEKTLEKKANLTDNE